MLREFRTERGLYILGAGASAADVPFGAQLMAAPALDYVRNAGSFPTTVPEKAALTKRIVAEARKVPLALVYPGREIRAWDDDYLYMELVERLPDFHARLYMKHLLSVARFAGRKKDSYRVFQLFHSGIIANYNHDGLADDTCHRFHRVIEMHGTIEPGFGSPGTAEFLAEAREYDLPVPRDNLLMCIPEPTYGRWHKWLRDRWQEIANFQPSFIAVIGFSFSLDDMVSRDLFLKAFRDFPGNVYVIGPDPYEVRHLLADGLRSRNVFGLPAYWNVLAHAMIVKTTRPFCGESLNYACQRILDTFGSGVSFPRPRD